MTWHVLDARSIWMREFTAALSQIVPTVGWTPRFGWTSLYNNRVEERRSADPAFRERVFPLQRGYSRTPISWLARIGDRLGDMLGDVDPDRSGSTLVCTTPFYAPVAEIWPGPVVYYLTDLTAAYEGFDADQIHRLDRRLCRVAARVCPNSRRIAEYCIRDAQCDPSKILIIPNATRSANVSARALHDPAPLPPGLEDLPRPVLGVMGNLADNMDWRLLEEAIRLTPEFSWVFVGPTDMQISDIGRRRARQRVLQLGGRVRATGMQPYGQLREFARAFDAAVLPYRKHEPTFSGSCTRFYEHLAACRPIFGTRGFAELLEKEPLIRLFDTPHELADGLATLGQNGFRDGLEEVRWKASHSETWDMRATAMVEALTDCPGVRALQGDALVGARS